MKIMISVGEASGDMHAAAALKTLSDAGGQQLETFGMGGKRLAAQGMEIIVDNEQHSVMGLVEVLHKYPQLRSHLTTLRRAMRDRKPDLLLLVDYPHFNMKLANTAKSLGVPVLYYIAPKVWASRPGRLQELAKLVDHMAVILPFEEKLFNDAGIPCTFVGNPLLDSKPLIEASTQQNTKQEGPRIALLPGSRKSEISYLLGTMLAAAELLKAKHPQATFILPLAETIDATLVTDVLEKSKLNVEIIAPSDYKSLATCKLAIVASGTATLELSILGVAMVVAYRMNPLSYAVVKRWLTIEHISLCNIIAGKAVVPELLQDDVTAESLFEHADQLITNEDAYTQQMAGLTAIYNKLGTPGATSRLCQLIISMVAKNRADKERDIPIALS